MRVPAKTGLSLRTPERTSIVFISLTPGLYSGPHSTVESREVFTSTESGINGLAELMREWSYGAHGVPILQRSPSRHC
jgi:hypothetical protein